MSLREPRSFEFGYAPPIPYNNPNASPFGHGRPLGKSVVISYIPPSSQGITRNLPIDMLFVEENEPTQMCLTLCPPKACFVDTFPSDLQNFQGPFQDNSQLQAAADLSLTNAKAIVDWGVGGVQSQVDVDFSNGLCLNLCASFLRCRATVEAFAGSGTTPLLYQLSAFVGRGFPKSNNAQRSLPFSLGAAAESQVTPTPRFAKAVSLSGIDATPGTLSSGWIRFWRTPAGSVDNQGVAEYFFSANSPSKFDVPNGAWYFSVVSGNPDTSKYQAIFDLAI